ncbi:hypothetical protein TNCV_590301 [Trichonephila clavipes]|nr:hypothetical protein TNCV_590301 [Trichonephila clavipes]
MGKTYATNRKTGHLSSTTADRHPVSHRNTCLIEWYGHLSLSLSLSLTLTQFSHWCFILFTYQPLWQLHPFLNQSALELIDGHRVGLRAAIEHPRTSYTCSMGLRSGDIAGHSNR